MSRQADERIASTNTDEARRLVEEVVRRDDPTLIEALLADAIEHLADEIDDLRMRVGVPRDAS